MLPLRLQEPPVFSDIVWSLPHSACLIAPTSSFPAASSTPIPSPAPPTVPLSSCTALTIAPPAGAGRTAIESDGRRSMPIKRHGRRQRRAAIEVQRTRTNKAALLPASKSDEHKTI
ncbi:hypothetical protein JCM11251_000465 [Rhodosporidiobolus azoricus]